MNRQIYKKIAKQNKTTIAQVKKEMQAAIDEVYVKPTFHANCIPCEGDIPTIDEFIEYCVTRIKDSGNSK